jgi:ribosomal protein S18 acetylase RimI-like enzyme
MVIDWPPHPAHPTQSRRGYVLNVYVEPSHRRLGLGRRLMELADAELAARGVSFVILHATEQGRRLYAELGWSATTEMSKVLPV